MQFRDKLQGLRESCATVFGVSRDNMKSHDEFKAKLELPFELIADTEEKNVPYVRRGQEQNHVRQKVKGIERSTFLIGPTARSRMNGAASRCRPCGRGAQGVKQLKKTAEPASRQVSTAQPLMR